MGRLVMGLGNALKNCQLTLRESSKENLFKSLEPDQTRGRFVTKTGYHVRKREAVGKHNWGKKL